MAIDLTRERTLGLAEAARRIPPTRNGVPVHPSTLTRWILAGAAAPDGRRVRLEAVRLGGRWVTSEEAIYRFALALTAGVDPASAGRPPSAGLREAERAGRELEGRGL